MKFLHILFTAVLLQSINLKAQNKETALANNQAVSQTIKGTVIDKSTKLPLSGVTIKLEYRGNFKGTKL
jgi:hypothetical protein